MNELSMQQRTNWHYCSFVTYIAQQGTSSHDNLFIYCYVTVVTQQCQEPARIRANGTFRCKLRMVAFSVSEYKSCDEPEWRCRPRVVLVYVFILELGELLCNATGYLLEILCVPCCSQMRDCCRC